MLVYAKNKCGVLHIDGYVIYGKYTNRKPVDIPYRLYQSSQDAFEDATYRENDLSKIFGSTFPELGFRYDELKHFRNITLDKIGLNIPGLQYDKKWTNKRKVEAIKRAIRECH